MSKRVTRRLAVLLLAANLAMAGIMRQEAAAFYSPCSTGGPLPLFRRWDRGRVLQPCDDWRLRMHQYG